MKIELRADGAHISGYVNVTGKHSRPIIKPDGIRCIEVIEERAFEKTLAKAGEVTVSMDHDATHIYASTRDNTLTLREDAIGLHADVLITDPDMIKLAEAGKIRGWSFGMYNVVDKIEERAGELPIRHITELDLSHITMVVNKVPCYAATSVEVRADEESSMEYRSDILDTPEVIIESKSEPKPDLSGYKNRVAHLRAV